jgi:D-alanyl-D-alanine-carboxypeptidase/D-alanyl-D-alanine-endopeptidase
MTGSGLGGPGPCTDSSAPEGSGGLYSTGDDMALWLHHNLAESDPVVSPTLALAHAVYRQGQGMTAAIGFDEAGPMDGLALGWVVIAARGHTPLIMQKSGGGSGFMSYIAFVPGREVGLFVAVNRVTSRCSSACPRPPTSSSRAWYRADAFWRLQGRWV